MGSPQMQGAPVCAPRVRRRRDGRSRLEVDAGVHCAGFPGCLQLFPARLKAERNGSLQLVPARLKAERNVNGGPKV